MGKLFRSSLRPFAHAGASIVEDRIIRYVIIGKPAQIAEAAECGERTV